jgi:hypothetical protein
MWAAEDLTTRDRTRRERTLVCEASWGRERDKARGRKRKNKKTNKWPHLSVAHPTFNVSG